MPRTTKDKVNQEESKELEKKVTKTAKKSTTKDAEKKTVVKKTTTKKPTTKSTVSKTDDKKNTTEKKAAVKASKTASKKEASKETVKKTASKKVADKKSTSKKSTTKATTKKTSPTKKLNSTKSTAKKDSSKTTTTKKKKTTSTVDSSLLPEYYDLPFKYNKTVVKLLAQTPKKLFIYWEISDEDRLTYLNQYGEHFFYDTKPVLIIHNLTMNYSFEIDINDFANCWYIDINDPDCLYDIELGRRPVTFNENIQTPYIYISSSNDLQSPNNHILFENINADTIFEFKNTKTKQITKKSLVNLSFLKDLNAIYGTSDLYQFYKKLYGENLLKELADTRLNNPSSGAISSFK